MRALIDSIGFLLCLALSLALITGMTVTTMRFILAPIFDMKLDHQLGMVTFLSYTILWQLSIMYGLVLQRKRKL
jgi:hypothetical protein